MNAELCDGTQLRRFVEFVKSLSQEVERMTSPRQVRALEQRLREQGRQILCVLLEHLLQSRIDQRQEQLRVCPDCGWRRRHQGVRERRLGSSLGSFTLRGIYFKCMVCGSCQHSVDVAGEEPVTELMRDLMLLVGVSSTSFDKAQVPRLKQAAQRLGHVHARRCIFVSDCAEWIGGAVREQLPSFLHVADYFHAAQHVHQAGELIYGKEHPDALKWSRFISRRLREQNAATLSDRLRRLALFYRDLSHQRAVLDLCRYLDKHASKMDYARFQREKIPIDSGVMESFCKQLGLRMKGPGMRWNVNNVTAMANLVSRWVADPQHAFTQPRAA
jgi:hypothetical protein